MSKYVYPQTNREMEKYMDEGGYGRSRIVSINKGGLELRDYFAAKAMPALIPEIPMESVAEFAYKVADAMLKAREIK